jgi:hypothetical protein
MTKPMNLLPRSNDVWEVGVAHADSAGGVMVVVERGKGRSRVATGMLPGEAPSVLFREAFVRPDRPMRAGRPAKVACEDPTLLDALRGVLAEADVPGFVEATPRVVEALGAMRSALSGFPEAPGLDSDAMAWRPTLLRLLARAPWRDCGESVARFSFAGHAGVGVFVAEPSPGFVMYTHPHEAKIDLALDPFDRDNVAMNSWQLRWLERDDLQADEIEACIRVGLQFVPGFYPRVMAASPLGFCPMAKRDRATFLAMLAGALSLVEREGSALMAGRAVSADVDGVAVSAKRPR